MKKIFTLIAAALVALNVNAKQDVDISSIVTDGVGTFNAWEWKGITLSSGDLILDEDAKTADDKNVTYFSASAFDYLIVEMEETTCNPQVIIQYKCKGTIGQYGAEFDQGQASGGASGMPSMMAIKLDPTGKRTINQIAFQPTSAGTITFSSVYFATQEEYDDAVERYTIERPAEGESVMIWKGQLVFPTDNWNAYTTIPATQFSAAEVGDIIRCYFIDPSSPNPVFKYGGTWSDFPQLQSSKKVSDKYFEGTITDEEALSKLKESGLSLQGQGFTLTQIDLVVPEAPKEYEATGKKLNVTDDGYIWASEFAGYSDDAKVVFVTTVANSEGFVGWGNVAITSVGGEVNAGNANVTGDGDNEAVFLLKELKEALDAPGFFKNEETGEEIPTESGLYWNVWGWPDQGDCTSTRKSVTIYEVVGFDGEGYVPAGNTGISNIQVAKALNGAIFNLAGQQVSKAVKGVYIQNGKKFVVK